MTPEGVSCSQDSGLRSMVPVTTLLNSIPSGVHVLKLGLVMFGHFMQLMSVATLICVIVNTTGTPMFLEYSHCRKLPYQYSFGNLHSRTDSGD